MITEISNVMDRAGGPSLMTGLQYAFHDKTPEKTRDTDLFSALGVPTVNLIDDVGHLAFSDIPKFATGNKMTPSTFRRVRGLVPFQNVPAIQQSINAFQGEVGTIYDWPAGHVQ
jgi:hypothetical protein